MQIVRRQGTSWTRKAFSRTGDPTITLMGSYLRRSGASRRIWPSSREHRLKLVEYAFDARVELWGPSDETMMATGTENAQHGTVCVVLESDAASSPKRDGVRAG